jgi:predicted HicB family RNase H-like nuclease
MKASDYKTNLTFRLNPQLQRLIVGEARRRDISPSKFVAEIVHNYMWALVRDKNAKAASR